MRKVIVLVVAFAFVAGSGFGQSPGPGPSAGFGHSTLSFRSTEWLGLSTGMVGSAGQIQTVNGVAKGPWFLGVGAGVDYYRFRSVPLFLSVTRDLAVGKRNWLFLYLAGGTNLPWYKRPAGSLITPGGGEATSVFHSGQYWSGGVGYLWKLGDHSKKAVLVSAGYTVKKLSEDQTEVAGCPIGDICMMPATPVVYEYLCRTYQFMIGFRF
jgi:hypothetical protein